MFYGGLIDEDCGFMKICGVSVMTGFGLECLHWELKWNMFATTCEPPDTMSPSNKQNLQHQDQHTNPS